MPEWSPSRRAVLQAGGAVGAAALAGCLPDGGDGGTDGPETGPNSPIDTIPAGVELVMHADVATLLNDDRLRTALNELLGSAGDRAPMGATDVQSALDAVESAAGLDPRAVRTLTAFGGYEADAAAGLRIEADWDESALRDAIGGGIEPETETYNDRTVYRYSESTVLGVLGGRTYVTGTTAGVEGAIDVAAGDAHAAAGQIREAFAAAPSGPLRFAFVAPADLGEGAGGSGPVDPSAFASITHGYGGYVADGDARSGSITLETDDATSAETLATQLGSARDAALERFESPSAERELASEFEALLSSLTFSAADSSVVVAVAEGEIFPVALLAVLGSFLLGLGSQQEVSPRAAFSFDYDSAGELTVTHTSGDSIPAAELALRGNGLEATGTWSELGGSASGDVGGQSAVVAGDSVSVSAEPDYEAQVIWQSAAGSTSSILSMDEGPEA